MPTLSLLTILAIAVLVALMPIAFGGFLAIKRRAILS
ncbi:hypothetical protein PMIT1313_02320 [Prochlorococcus marinus str. MIT 1313]|nr:hypothetical protein PMIT1313_02320 [Prochlorococcus marinus str. MIT 1313]KZR71068.1 hypothetical protein PMIT1318_02210 [Prochlorococcus marinus str. MIT 1318]